MSLTVDQLAKPLKVVKKIRETSDAVSLVLEIPGEFKSLFQYQAGQFVTFFMDIGGETLNRSYSLSTSPIVDQDFKVTVKKVSGGKGSTYLCDQIKEGDTLWTAPPAGHFFKPSLEATRYFLFAAGSGITPIYSILKTVLSASSLNHVTLVFCNRNEDSIIYRREIDEWAKNHPSRLDVLYVCSKPTGEWGGHCGRLSRELVGELLKMPTPGPTEREYYICGPSEFMTVVRLSLHENGVPKDKIREEDFAIALRKPKVDDNDAWTFIGPDKVSAYPEKIIVELNGETHEVESKEGQSILETLLASGVQAPYSCMDGACMACMAKIQEGRVYQEDPGILMDENISKCEALTCQAKPLSRIVKLSYDEL